MSAARDAVLVLGIGNLLMGDEGVGVHVVRRLLDGGRPIAPDVRVVDGGTLGLDLLPLISDAGALIVVDAAELHAEPGAVRILRDGELDGAMAGHLSVHQVGLSDLLAVGRLTDGLPARLALVAIQPGAIEVGVELTPECRAAVPVAVDAIRGEIDALCAAAAVT